MFLEQTKAHQEVGLTARIAMKLAGGWPLFQSSD